MIDKVETIEFYNLRSFRKSTFNFNKKVVMVGQNDHGKSSVFKILDVLFNKLKKEYFSGENALPEEIFKIINPVFFIGNAARRIIIRFVDKKKKPLIITFKEANISVHYEKAARGLKSDVVALKELFTLIESVSFIHIPAARDANSQQYIRLFNRLMEEKGLSEIVPRVSGGTRREYRLLKNIRKQLQDDITPFLDKAVLPVIKKNVPLNLPYNLKIDFQVDINKLIDWINQSLVLGIQLGEKSDTLPVTELGSGVQSLLMLALHSVLLAAEKNKQKKYLLAIEEPEAFLHPQAQRNMADYLHNELLSKDNIYLSVSTHSPYILNTFSLDNTVLVRKDNLYSKIYYPNVDSSDAEVLNDYNNEINSEIFFAKAVLFVEGDSDKRVFYALLKNIYGIRRGDITIIEVGGNKSFSPYLRLIKSLQNSKIPWGVVTDFDSFINSDGERPFLRGIGDAGIRLDKKDIDFICGIVNETIDSNDEEDYIKCTEKIMSIFKSRYNLNVYIFPSDLEWALCSKDIKDKVCQLIKEHFNKDLTGQNLNSVRQWIGSKGIPIGDKRKDAFKKPFLHEKIALLLTQQNISSAMKKAVEFVYDIIPKDNYDYEIKRR